MKHFMPELRLTMQLGILIKLFMTLPRLSELLLKTESYIRYSSHSSKRYRRRQGQMMFTLVRMFHEMTYFVISGHVSILSYKGHQSSASHGRLL